MVNKILNSKLLMTWLDMVLKFGMNIILLPIATIFLSHEELAYFLFIGTLLGLAYLAEGGINRTILRATSYFKEGATSLPQSFDDIKNIKSGIINYKLLGKLVGTSYFIYLFMAFLSLVILFSVGFFASKNILMKQPDVEMAKYSFYLLGLFAFLYIQSLRWIGLIQGLGFLARQKRIEILFGVFRIFLSAISIIFGYGVFGVLVSMVISVILSNILYKKMFYNLLSKEKIASYQTFELEMIKKLWPSAWRQSILAWGSYLIYQSATLVIVQINDTTLIASYLLTLQVVNFVLRIANAPAYSYYPEISKTIVNHNIYLFKKLLLKSLKISIGIYIIAAILIYMIGNNILQFINSKTFILSGDLLLLILIVYLFELHHVIHATIYTATNHIPFVLPAILSGIVIISGGFLVVDSYGLWGVIIIQFFVQLSFNNWYPIWLNIKLLKKIN